jgi:signal peptidase
VTTPFQRLVWRALTAVQVVGVVVLVGLSALLLAGIVPGVLGYESFEVSSVGMQPAIQIGSLAIIGPVKVEQLSVGDVVVYRKPLAPEAVVMQRLLYVDADQPGKLNLQTRGDFEPVAEQVTVAPGVTLGRVLYSIPRLGLLVDFVNQVAGKVLLLGVPAVLLGVDYLRNRLRRRRQATSPVLDHTQRIEALLAYGRRALLAAHPQLAMRAAHGVLVLDPRNEAAFGLSAQAQKALEDAREHAAA